MKLVITIILAILTTTSGCQAGFFANDLGSNSAIKAVNISDNNLAQILSQKPAFEYETNPSSSPLFNRISQFASQTQLAVREFKSSPLKDYLSDLLLFLERTPQYQKSINQSELKDETIEVLKQLVLVIKNADAPIKNSAEGFQKLLDELKNPVPGLKAPIINPGSILENRLGLKEPLIKLFTSSDLDIKNYAEYLARRGFSVGIIDASALENDAQKLKLTDEQKLAWLNGIIEKQAELHSNKMVAILINAPWIKDFSSFSKPLGNAHVIVPVTTIDGRTTVLPRLNLFLAQKLIDDLYPKDASVLKELAKIALALDAENFTIGRLDELIQRYFKNTPAESLEQKSFRMKEELRKYFNIDADGLIAFIANSSAADVESKVSIDSSWFYKNFQDDFGSLTADRARRGESKARFAIDDGDKAKDKAGQVTADIREKIKTGEQAKAQAKLAQNDMKLQLQKIKDHQANAPLLAARKKAETEQFIETFQKQINELFTKAFSDINKEDLANTQRLQETLQNKIDEILKSPKAKELKDLIDKEGSTLDSRINTFEKVKAVAEHEITQAIGKIAFEAGAGWLMGGPAGAVKGAVKATVNISLKKLLNYLTKGK